MQGPDKTVMPEVTFRPLCFPWPLRRWCSLEKCPIPETGKLEKHPELARHSIDILNMLEDKITNGLTEKESRLLRDVLFELRMKYVAAGK